MLRWAAVAALLGVVGCGRRQQATRTFSVLDSANVRVAYSGGPAWQKGEAWELSERPTVQVGVVEGDARYEFSFIGAGVVLSDGGFVIGDASNTVRAYSNRGELRWTEGGKGEGPGEYLRINSIRPLATDSLVVFDGALLRVTVLTTAGAFVRTADLTDSKTVGAGAIAALPLADGTMMVVTGGSSGLLPSDVRFGVAREIDPAQHVGPTGLPLSTIGPFPGFEWYLTEHTMGAAPFGHLTTYAVTDSALVVGTGDDASVQVYSPDGHLAEVVRWAGEGLGVAKADIDAYRASYLARAQDAEQRRTLEQLLAGMTMPTRRPAYSRIAVDRDGNLWVTSYHLPWEPARNWAVFSVQGQLLGEVACPEGFRVLDIGSTAVLGVWTDDVDVQHVRIYEIKK